jgi:hypothetical protein
MSGFTGVLAAMGGGVVNPLPSIGASDAVDDPGDAIAYISVNADGTISYNVGGSPTSAKWFNPSGGSPGSSYYVKFTLSTGVAWDAGLVSGTVYSLGANRQIALSRLTVGSSSNTGTISIYADAGGTQLLTSGSFSMSSVVSGP